jgi:hypothetical protein
MGLYDLSFEEKNEIEINILNFKKENFDNFIQTGILIGDLAKNIKDKKELYINNIDNFSPIWMRLMSEEVEKILNQMEEVLYQINRSEEIVKDKNNINNIEKYRKIVLKREKNKKILKPLLPLIKNKYLINQSSLPLGAE